MNLLASTLTAASFLSSLAFGAHTTSTPFKPISIVSNHSISQDKMIQDFSFIFDDKVNTENISISMTFEDAKIDLVSKRLLSFMHNEVVEMGEDPSYIDFFLQTRQKNEYEKIFSQLEAHGTHQTNLAILNILSGISYYEATPWEKNFVISQMKSGISKLQEYALNTLSLWNDKTLMLEISNFEIRNPFLLKKYKKMLGMS